jgi:cysteine sulfinate desulfinase/cysteine desulfurase-like protein
MGRMYFDHTSKTPAGWHVPDAMLPHFNRQLGNHSSVFIEEGVIPKKAADEALLPVTSDSIKRLMEVLNKDREGDMEWQKNHIATK